jgi:hypothetical protein
MALTKTKTKTKAKTKREKLEIRSLTAEEIEFVTGGVFTGGVDTGGVANPLVVCKLPPAGPGDLY